MRELNLALAPGPGPLYLRLAGALRTAFEEGVLQPGELLPSTRNLAREAGAHRHTVMAALDELIAEGWVLPEPGRGYRVVPTLPLEFFRVRAQHPGPDRARKEWQPTVELEEWDGLPECPYAFPSGQPDLRRFPTEEFFGCMREVMRQADATELLSYGESAGSPRLRDELRTYLRRVRSICEGEPVVTHSSQEAIFLLARLLLEPGDTVAVEAMGYPPAWEALRLAGARLEGLPVDADGVDPDDLDRLARRTRVKLAYLTPLHQYPTTVTLSLERRMALYDTAERHGIALLEDDYDHEFHYRCRPLAPLKARDPAGLVLYVSTFSKVVFPAVRLGFAVVPPRLRSPLAALKRITSRQNESLTQEAMARWMAGGGFERHLRRMRRLYERRMEAMATALEAHGYAGRFRRPGGGMSLWVEMGVPSRELSLRAKRHGVAVRPAQEYRLDGADATCLRLGFASSTEADIAEGISRLVRA